MKMYVRPVQVLQKTPVAPVRHIQNEDVFPMQREFARRHVNLVTNEIHPMNAKVLIVDDEPNVRLMYRAALEASGCEVYEADSGAKALDQCMAREHDVAVLDLRMPGGMDGLELLQEMVNLNIRTPAIMITAHGDILNAVTAMKLGAIDFLQKPILPEELRNVVRDVLVRHEPEDEGQEPHDLDDCLRRAKRAINLRDFDAAKSELINALEIDPESRQAINLVGVMLEMRGEYDDAKRAQTPPPTVEATSGQAPWNMRRIFSLFHSGSGKEPSDTETL